MEGVVKTFLPWRLCQHVSTNAEAEHIKQRLIATYPEDAMQSPKYLKRVS